MTSHRPICPSAGGVYGTIRQGKNARIRAAADGETLIALVSETRAAFIMPTHSGESSGAHRFTGQRTIVRTPEYIDVDRSEYVARD